MKRLSFLILAGVVLVAVVIGLSLYRTCGSLRTPVSESAGSAAVFQAGETDMVTTITNLFSNLDYRGMMLCEVAGVQQVIPGCWVTNGFVLLPGLEPIASVPVNGVGGKTQFPYKAYFHITVAPIGVDQTRVAVRTILAQVVHGKEPGIHGGLANHYQRVAPVRREEENVLKAIETALSTKNGSTNEGRVSVTH